MYKLATAFDIKRAPSTPTVILYSRLDLSAHPSTPNISTFAVGEPRSLRTNRCCIVRERRLYSHSHHTLIRQPRVAQVVVVFSTRCQDFFGPPS
ncbi:hypothetical protein J6590_037173 [Homalodisca vitripennis]|nr:hypothetical protein J6590_037173 [Homalodisca vitripennis]